MDYKTLANEAIKAQKMSYAPYSKFNVGAAILTKNGKIYQGCNIESAAYSPTCCAERTALVKAVSEGEREFAAIAVVGSAENSEPEYCYPCGVCRQFLKEFSPDDMPVIIVKSEDDFKVHKFSEILPYSFGPADLGVTP